jgi:endo-1,4-beta-xylanase
MIMFRVAVLFSLMFLCSMCSAELPPGEVLIDAKFVDAYVTDRADGKGAYEKLVTNERPHPVGKLRVTTRTSNPWDVLIVTDAVGAIEVNDVGFLTFEARAIMPDGQSSPDAIAKCTAFLEDKTTHQKKAATFSFQFSGKWQTINVPFQIEQALPDGEVVLSIHAGGEAQGFEYGPLTLINYKKTKSTTDLPRMKITYQGRDPDSPWRAEAQARIEQHRMASLKVNVLDASKKPIEGAMIKVTQTKNDFGFGTAVAAHDLLAQTADGDRYRKIVEEHFNRAVLENDLKMEPWDQGLTSKPGDYYNIDQTMNALQWLNERRIDVRGHYLCWAPWEPWSEKLRNDPEKIKSRILEHIPKIASRVGDRVFEWDAINHLAGWDKNIDEAVGLDFYTEVMKQCRKSTALPLWVNEDQVFRPGRQQDDYYDRIVRLIKAGQVPDGIGNQAHFDVSFLPSPQQMLDISDRFAALVPRLEITEFDITSQGDEELEADYMEDVLTVCYSHPAYTGFIMWGFWEPKHWKPTAALWRKDWSEKPSAIRWRELVNQRWKTKTDGKSDVNGSYATNGHLGDYQIEVEHAGKRVSVDYRLKIDGQPLVVELK